MYLSWVEPPVNIVKSKNTLKSIIFAVTGAPHLFSASIHDGGDIKYSMYKEFYLTPTWHEFQLNNTTEGGKN